MSSVGAPAGWYPDPDGSGGQRYFDGNVWTQERTGPPTYPPQAYGYTVAARPLWKGAQYGRPAYGPGSLANVGRRLGARLLDILVMLPVYVLFAVIAIIVVSPHVGPVFPKVTTNDPNATVPFPGFFWIELAVFGSIFVAGLVTVAYEWIATAKYGRTFGKAWLHIRPLRADGTPLGWGRSLGRCSIYWASGMLSWIGLLDPLWCLWDEGQQCLHDKAVGTIVINDTNGAESSVPTVPLEAPRPPTQAVPGWWVASDGNWYPPHLQPGAAPTYVSHMPVVPPTNGMAVASLVCSIAGFFLLGIPSIVGVILGFVARSRIRASDGTQAGSGLALSGIIVGFGTAGFWFLVLGIPALVALFRGN